MCLEKKIYFFIANHPYLAQKYKADGLHAKEKDLHNSILKLPHIYHSVSCHNIMAALQAQKLGYDFIFYSPIFKSTTHNDNKYLGRMKFNLQTRFLKIPVIALGGINNHNIKQLQNLNIKGFAAIDYYL